MTDIPAHFYAQHDVVGIARQLLGKRLTTLIEGHTVSGLITETEAYAGVVDRASHAFGNRRTTRTETMYGPPGRAYVYLCYGIHAMLNVVTAPEGTPHAVLIRSLIIDLGLEVAQMRRRKGATLSSLTDGPGKVAQAMGLSHRLHDGLPLLGPEIIIHHDGIHVPDTQVSIGPRIGVEYAAEHALLPYRFVWTKG